jgi:hypothetical protein
VGQHINALLSELLREKLFNRELKKVSCKSMIHFVTVNIDINVDFYCARSPSPGEAVVRPRGLTLGRRGRERSPIENEEVVVGELE